MISSTQSNFRLNQTQERVERGLRQAMRHFVEQVARPALRKSVVAEFRSNVFALNGSRGSGKSTILGRLSGSGARGRSVELSLFGTPEAQETAGEPLQSGKVFVADPIDCSVLPQAAEDARGMAVIVHLFEQLRDDMPDVSRTRLSDLAASLATSTGLGSRGYASLVRGLSTDPDDFGEYLAHAIRHRLKLRRTVGEFLEGLARVTGHDAFIVRLDDFDLVDAAQTRSWIQAFLDELRQPLLVVVITADFDRLDYLAYDKNAQMDDKTGRALLQKAVPVQNRWNILAWSLHDRLAFPHPEVVPGSLQDRLTRSGAVGQEHGADAVLLSHSMLLSLVPRTPRGLVDLNAQFEVADRTQDPISGWHLLEVVAEARGEPLLRKRLRELSAAADWIGALPLRPVPDHVAEQDMTQILWRDSVTAACQQNVGRVRGLAALVKPPAYASALQPPNGVAPKLQQIIGPSSDHDPLLRHTLLRYHPLRDAAPPDQPIWSQLILDLALNADPENRWQFVKSWGLARARLQDCVAELTLGGLTPQIAEHARALGEAPNLWQWVQWDVSDAEDVAERRVQIGVWPFVRALARERDSYPEALWRPLYIPPPVGQSLDRDKRYRLWPGSVAALTILIDALHRAPWSSMGHRLLRRDLRLFVVLAVAFTKGAYDYARIAAADRLDDIGDLCPDEALSELVEHYRDEATVNLLHGTDRALFGFASAVLGAEVGDGLEPSAPSEDRAKLPRGGVSTALADAAKAFCETHAFKDAQRLAKELAWND